MVSPSTLTLVAFLAFAVEQIAAEDPKEQIGKLPTCAQACITKAFSTCKCKIFDFSCACTCNVFRPYSESCTDTSCAASYLKTVLDDIDGTCAAFTNTATALQQTSSVSSSTEASLTTTSISTDTITSSLTDASIATTPTDVTFSKDVVDPTITESPSTTPGGFYPYSSTMTHQTYSLCYPFLNGTKPGHNSTGYCSGNYTNPGYTGPAYTGNLAVGCPEHSSWILSLVLFILGLFAI